MASIHEVLDKKGKMKSYSVSYRYRERTGKIKQSMKRGFLRKKDAEAFARSVETDFYNHTVKSDVSMTLFQLLDKWNDEVLSKKLVLKQMAQNTVSGYRVNIRHLKDGIGNIKLVDLAKEHIEDFYISQYETGNYRTGETLSLRTLEYIHTTLHSALKFAVDKGYMKYNPAIGTGMAAKSMGRPRICSNEEITLLRRNTIDTELEMPVYLSLSLGLRRGEVLGLTWDCIDFVTKTVRIEKQWAMTASGYAFTHLKTANSRRELPLTDEMCSELLSFKSNQNLAKIEQSDLRIDYGFVCCNKDGAPIRPEYMSQAFSRLVDRLSIPSLRFHDLRHTFASRALSDGASLFHVSRMLGHASISITADIYGHPIDDSIRSEAQIAFSSIWKKN